MVRGEPSSSRFESRGGQFHSEDFRTIIISAKVDSWLSLLPAGLYLLVHILEGEMVTPMLLARRFTLNPVLVIISLIFWFWMWGIVGAVLAVPLLAIAKIVCDGIKPLNAIGHFLEGDRDGGAHV